MKVIIAGSRTLQDYALLEQRMNHFNSNGNITEVVCGGARGADYLGQRWAIKHGIHVSHFPADWNTYGKSAGYKRNEQMGEYADALVAFWDGQSRGTKHMIDIMKKLNKPIRIVTFPCPIQENNSSN